MRGVKEKKQQDLAESNFSLFLGSVTSYRELNNTVLSSKIMLKIINFQHQ